MSSQTRAIRRIKQHIEKLHHPDIDTASRAEGYLVRYYGDRAIELLIEACSHRDPQVRYRAVWALGHIHNPRAYDTILQLTHDPDPAVRYDATWALGVLGDDRAVEASIELMNTPDPEGSIDSAAAQGLGDLGKPAVPALIENLGSGSPTGRGMTAYVLGDIGDEAAIEPLVRLLSEEDKWLRIAGIESLAQIEEKRGGACCRGLIEKRLNDPVECVRENAVYWLKELQSLDRKAAQQGVAGDAFAAAEPDVRRCHNHHQA